MSVTIDPISPSDVITVRISGRVTFLQWSQAQREVAAVLEKKRSAALLVIAQDFQGWERGGDWEDDAFQRRHDSQIQRMAIVGERKWEDLALMFVGKWFRKFPIEYFPPDRIAQARQWLTSHDPAVVVAPAGDKKGAQP